MSTCAICRQPAKELWAWGPNYPKWKIIASANFVDLVHCPNCAAEWLQGAYEPFASFQYSVRWRLGEQGFSRAIERDGGATLFRWHQAEIRWLANKADEGTLAQIDVHYKRSRGYVDLTKSDLPNNIDLMR